MAPIPPELQAIMEKALPMEGEEGEPEAGDPKPEVAEQPAKPETADSKSTLRLAPDFEAPEPKPEVAVPEIEITDEMIDAEKSPKKQADMRKFRDALTALKGEVARLKEQPAAKPAEDAGLSAVVEQQRQQLADMSARLERQNAVAHPIFQQQFVQPRDAMFAQASETVKEAGGDVEAFERAMTLNGKNRTAALDEVVGNVESHILRTRLERLIDGIDSKEREINAALKDAKGLNEKMARDEKIARHEMIQRQEKELVSMLEATESRFLEGLDSPEGGKVKLEVLQKVGRKGYEWWDEQADDIRATAREILLKGTPQKIATAAVLAASCGAYKSLYENERRARMAAEKRNQAQDDAEPDLKDRRQTNGAADEFGPDANITDVALARLRRGDFNKR
jgi:hypothetical protein